MKRYSLVIALAVMVTACGSSNPLGTTAPSAVTSPASAGGSGRLSSQSVALEDVTYVGPIRLPISVHGTTVQLSWLGNDNATRGYELEFQRYDVTNVWVPDLHDVVTKPEAKEFLTSEGTYRVRVRGLFDVFEGGYTDYVVFSTDDHNTPAPPPPPPVVIIPPPVECVLDCAPPPPPVVCQPNEHLVDGQCVHNGDGDGNGNGQGDDHGNGGGNDNPGPPAFVDVDFCHAEFHQGHGGKHPVPDSYTYQDKTAHSQAELDQHIGQHENDYLGACQQ